MKNENIDEGYNLLLDIQKQYNGFNQIDIIDTYENYFIIKRYVNTCDIYDKFQYELWKYNNSTNKIEKIDLGKINYLEIKSDFLIVYKVLVIDSKPIGINELYKLPNLTKVMTSNAYGININDTKDYYIVQELEEDNNGDLEIVGSELIDKESIHQIKLPWNIRNRHVIRNAFKDSKGDLCAIIYDYKNRNGFLWKDNIGVTKTIRKFCKYDDNKILVYDDLNCAKVIDYDGNLIKKIKIDINLDSDEELLIYDFKNGIARYLINYFSPNGGYSKYGIINLEGNRLIPHYQNVILLDNDRYIFQKDLFKCYLKDLNSQTNNEVYIGNYVSKIKNGYMFSRDSDNSFILDTNGKIILHLPICVIDFEVKDNLIALKSNSSNYLYDLQTKQEIINSKYNINIIDNETIIINDEIKKISDLNKKNQEEITEEKIEKPKLKFLSRFNFKKKM